MTDFTKCSRDLSMELSPERFAFFDRFQDDSIQLEGDRYSQLLEDSEDRLQLEQYRFNCFFGIV